MSSDKKTCLIIGDPVTHSLSPIMHAAAYKALSIEEQYTFNAEHVTPAELGKFMQDVRSKDIHMLAVTIPHKVAIMQYLDEIESGAKQIGAVNTVLNEGGKLVGYNTDCPGAMNALYEQVDIPGINVVVLGSGGTARAIVCGLMREKASVTLCARNVEKAKELSERYHCEMLPWEERNHALDADVIINTTPVGKEGEAFPLIAEGIKTRHIVFDANYNAKGTTLLRAAKEKNATFIDGLELLLQQGMIQFQLYTGLRAPEIEMRKALQNAMTHAKAN